VSGIIYTEEIINNSNTQDEHLPDDEKFEATWRKDAKLRQEFSCAASYIAFMKAQTNGQVRILQR